MNWFIQARAGAITITQDGHILVAYDFWKEYYSPNGDTTKTSDFMPNGTGFMKIHAQTGRVFWAKRVMISRLHTSTIQNLKVDERGNVYFFGQMGYNTVILGDERLSGGSSDNYLAKCDSTLKLKWINQFKNNNQASTTARDMAVDDEYNLYVTGEFHDAITFDSIKLQNFTGRRTDAYVAKIDSAGKTQWALKCWGMYNEESAALALDNNDHIYLQASHGDSVVVGNYVFRGNGFNPKILIAQIDRDSGSVEWAFSGGSSRDDLPHDLLFRDSLLWASGIFGQFYNLNIGGWDKAKNPADFGPFTLKSASGAGNGYILRFNMNQEPVTRQPAIEQKIQVYPNPAGEYLHVSLPVDDAKTYRIVNVSGETVKRGSLVTTRDRSMSNTISVNSLPPGLYVLQVTNGRQQYVARFSKTK